MSDGKVTEPEAAVDGPTRRDFIAGASAAGTVLVGGCATTGKSKKAAVATQSSGSGRTAARPYPRPQTRDVNVPRTGFRRPQPKRPTCLAMIDATRAVTCDDDGNVTVWTLGTPAGSNIQRDPCKIKTHGDKVSYVAAGTAPGGVPRIYSASYDGYVFVTDLDQPNCRDAGTFEEHRHLQGEVWVVAVSPAGKVLSATNGGELYYWEATQPGTIPPLGGPWYPQGPIGGMAFIDENEFLTTHQHGVMQRWDLRKMIGVQTPAPEQVYQTGSHQAINSVAVGAEMVGTTRRRIAVTGDFDTWVIKWDLDAPPPPPNNVPRLYSHLARIWRVALSGDFVASCDDRGDVQVRTLAGQQTQPGVPNEPGGVMGVAFAVGINRVFYTTGPLAQPQNPQIKWAAFK